LQNRVKTRKKKEINNEEIEIGRNKKKYRLYDIRKARQFGYFYNFEKGRYDPYRKFSNLNVKNFLFHFVLGTYNKQLKLEYLINNVEENSNLIVKPNFLKIVDKSILNKNKNKFKKYFTLFKIFL
jgi:hypothetical protein